jgi:hypothetical protein
MIGSSLQSHTVAMSLLLATLPCLLAACALGGPVIPDNTQPIATLDSDDKADPNDIFVRDPWELWKMPNGNARYHRGTFMLLPDKVESFKASDISVFAKDGSDVRLDYQSVDFGSGSQSVEAISVFVYRATGDIEGEWASVVDRWRGKHAGAEPAQPFPIPLHYPANTKQAALMVRRDDRFFQVSLFRSAGWTVRYQIECPAQDVEIASQRSLAFLRAIRYRE